VGGFFLLRTGWVIWKQPLVWGALVAAAQALVLVNQWPLGWMTYDTALSAGSFVAQRLVQVVVSFIYFFMLYGLTFIAAESLTRRAFPAHPQFWRIWSPPAASTPAIAGRTLGGYLLVPLLLAYVVGLYLLTTRFFGWWNPSSTLYDPDVLATYFPWFSPLAQAFEAGFWEESAFRAIPLAGAALIGERFGNRIWWIAGAFVLQIAIFGAGHAPYPTEPAYARPVELIIPAAVFGIVYLRFGLLPAIIAHFGFDAVQMAIPIFVSSAPGIVVSQVIVVVLILLALWVVLVRRFQVGAWLELAPSLLNAAWKPAATAVETVQSVAAAPPAAVALPWRAIVPVGVVGALVWIALVGWIDPLRHATLQLGRERAVAQTRGAVDHNLAARWWFLPSADSGAGDAHVFVWQTAGRRAYDGLLGTYLDGPGWTVNVRTFEGDVAERAENWSVRIDREGNVERVSHVLPEARAGPALDEAAARAAAYRAAGERFGLQSASLRLIEAIPSRLPSRTDWNITFEDRTHSLPQGELRIGVRIAGNEIAGMRRFVYVPDEWQRRERDAASRASIVWLIVTVVASIVIGGGAICAVIAWSRAALSLSLFAGVAGLLVVLGAVSLANDVPLMMAHFSTAQPLGIQIAVGLGAAAVFLGLRALFMGLMAAAIPRWSAAAGSLPRSAAIIAGLCAGALASAARAGGEALQSSGPSWPNYAGAASYVPFASATLGPLASSITATALALIVVATAERFSAGWTRRTTQTLGAVWIVAGILGNTGSALDLATWIASGLIIGAVFAAIVLFVVRHDVAIVPFAIATIASALSLRNGLAQPFPAALPGAIAGIVLMWVVATWWHRALARREVAA
ncbi:MAG: CPBP family intramembrane metalloprotease, partial [Candidatus Eremiobacteraeota bacterium]|nr:CPBP family intramembrane metalloprotease [Candidatus Eremiobacteraeota bacterium]